MISVEEARERILADLQPTPAEVVALANAWSRVAAGPVIARLTQPPADVSAMDGYAVRAADGALGAVLHLIGSAPAGHPYEGTVGPGETVRLFTGSVLSVYTRVGTDTPTAKFWGRDTALWSSGATLTLTDASGHVQSTYIVP